MFGLFNKVSVAKVPTDHITPYIREVRELRVGDKGYVDDQSLCINSRQEAWIHSRAYVYTDSYPYRSCIFVERLKHGFRVVCRKDFKVRESNQWSYVKPVVQLEFVSPEEFVRLGAM